MAEGEPGNPVADELLSHVAIDTPASRQAVASGAGMFLIDPDRAQQFVSDIRAAAFTLSEGRWMLGDARWRYSPDTDRVSANFADQASAMADRAVAAADRQYEALIGVANELQRQLSAYRQVEQINASGAPV